MVTVTEREEGGEMGVSFIVVTRSRLLLVFMCVCVCVCVCRHSPHVCVFVKGDPSACFFRYVNVCVIIQFDENGYKERTKFKPLTIFQSKKMVATPLMRKCVEKSNNASINFLLRVSK